MIAITSYPPRRVHVRDDKCTGCNRLLKVGWATPVSGPTIALQHNFKALQDSRFSSITLVRPLAFPCGDFWGCQPLQVRIEKGGQNRLLTHIHGTSLMSTRVCSPQAALPYATRAAECFQEETEGRADGCGL